MHSEEARRSARARFSLRRRRAAPSLNLRLSSQLASPPDALLLPRAPVSTSLHNQKRPNQNRNVTMSVEKVKSNQTYQNWELGYETKWPKRRVLLNQQMQILKRCIRSHRWVQWNLNQDISSGIRRRRKGLCRRPTRQKLGRIRNYGGCQHNRISYNKMIGDRIGRIKQPN